MKPLREWYLLHEAAENLQADLTKADACVDVVAGAAHVYNLAADMGGMGFIATHNLACMLSSLVSTHMLSAAADANVERFFFSSSACVYPTDRQRTPEAKGLREDDAYPASPEHGYGWEKLFGERMAMDFRADAGLETRIARYHNIYGPYGTFDGGREKAPAAICRKVATAKLHRLEEIEIWGDGRQTRSFTFIDDCVEGTLRIMNSAVPEPLNLGSSELVTINRLVDLVEEIADVRLRRTYVTEAPQGVRGRNSDNARIRALRAWEPSTPLRDGLELTYRWVYDRIAAGGSVRL